MRVVPLAAVAATLLLLPSVARAGQNTSPSPASQTPQPAQAPAAQTPAAQTPPAQTPPAQTPQPAAGGAAAQATPPARTFNARAGLLFNTVKADKTADFEKVIGYLQAALAKATDPTVQAQARGWRAFKVSEPGPNSTVLYVFVLDPAVPSADYGLGHILGQAYTDPAELQEIWNLYTNSVTSGGTLLNLTPVGAALATPDTAPPPFTQPDEPKMLPPDADPNRR